MFRFGFGPHLVLLGQVDPQLTHLEDAALLGELGRVVLLVDDASATEFIGARGGS